MTIYRHLSDERLYRWAKSMIAKKGSEKQREFLAHVADDSPDEFVDYVESCIGNRASAYKNPDGETPTLLDQSGQPVVSMTAGHMYLMPAKDIQRLHDHWRDIPYGDAVCPTLWGAITLSEIRAGRIHPVWLAVDRKGCEDATRKEIERSLREKQDMKIDTLVRRCMRWMTAPGTMRGAPELYGNCSLAKAWWCGHFSRLVHDQTKADLDEIVKSLQKSWLGLTDYLAGKLTVIGEPSVIAGFTLWARKRLDQEKQLPRKHVERTCQTLGEISSWCVLGWMSAEEIERKIFGFKPVTSFQEDVH